MLAVQTAIARSVDGACKTLHEHPVACVTLLAHRLQVSGDTAIDPCAALGVVTAGSDESARIHEAIAGACARIAPGLDAAPGSPHALLQLLEMQTALRTQWATPLVAAIRTTLARRPYLADTSSKKGLDAFVQEVASLVPESEPALRARIAMPDAGILLRQLVQACEDETTHVLPAFIGAPLQQAAARLPVLASPVRRPGLVLDAHTRTVSLHLPVVPLKDAAWELELRKDTRTIPAQFTPEALCLHPDILPADGRLRLRLRIGRKAPAAIAIDRQVFPTADAPAVFFDAASGAWTRGIHAADTCLRAGTFHVLVHGEEPGAARIAPGVSLLAHCFIGHGAPLEDALSRHGLRCSSEPWVRVQGAPAVRTAQGNPVFGIDAPLRVSAAFGGLDSTTGTILSIEVAGPSPRLLCERLMLPDARFADRVQAQFTAAELQALLRKARICGPVTLRFSVFNGCAAATTEILAWPGFRNLDAEGLACDPPSGDFHAEGLFDPDADGIRKPISDKIHALHLLHTLRGATTVLDLAAPGIHVRKIANGYSDSLGKDGNTIVTAGNDFRIICSSSHRHGPCEIRTEALARPVVIDGDDCVEIPVQELISAPGAAPKANLDFLHAGKRIFGLGLSCMRPLEDLRLTQDGRGADVYAFRVRAQGFNALRLKIRDYTTKEFDEIDFTIPFKERTGRKGSARNDDSGLMARWSNPAHDRGYVHWRISFDEDAAPAALYTTLCLTNGKAGAPGCTLATIENGYATPANIWLRCPPRTPGDYNAPVRLLLCQDISSDEVDDTRIGKVMRKIADLAVQSYPGSVRAETYGWLSAISRAYAAAMLKEGCDIGGLFLGHAIAQLVSQSDRSRPWIAPLLLGECTDLLAIRTQELTRYQSKKTKDLADLPIQAILAYLDNIHPDDSDGEAVPEVDDLATSLRDKRRKRTYAYAHGLTQCFERAFVIDAIDKDSLPMCLSVGSWISMLRDSHDPDAPSLARLRRSGIRTEAHTALCADHVHATLRKMEDRMQEIRMSTLPERRRLDILLGRLMRHAATPRRHLAEASCCMDADTDLRLSHAWDDPDAAWTGWTESPALSNLEQATFLVAGLCRVASRHRQPGRRLKALLEEWIDCIPADLRKRLLTGDAPRHTQFLRLILSIAPEWFTCAFAVWELSLPPALSPKSDWNP